MYLSSGSGAARCHGAFICRGWSFLEYWKPRARACFGCARIPEIMHCVGDLRERLASGKCLRWLAIHFDDHGALYHIYKSRCRMGVTASRRTWADIGDPDVHFFVPEISQIHREKVGPLDRRLLCTADLAQGNTGSQDDERNSDNLLH